MASEKPRDYSISVAAAVTILATNFWCFQQSALTKCSNGVGFREIRQLKVVTEDDCVKSGLLLRSEETGNALGKIHYND